MKAITPYLNFDGNAREAMTFYAECLGAELSVQSFNESGMPAEPGTENRVMHARLSKGPLVIMASDTMPGWTFQQGNNFHITLECESADELQRLYSALGAGGTSTMEPQDTFWGARFAMLIDKYGIGWMFNYELPKA